MNPETLFQTIQETVQQGFRVAVGAGSTIVETIQTPQSGLDAWTQLTRNPTQLAQDLAQKGETTEREAREWVDRFLEQQRNPSATGMTVTTTATPIAPDLQMELQELTAQLTAIRTELAQLREQRQSS